MPYLDNDKSFDVLAFHFYLCNREVKVRVSYLTLFALRGWEKL